ncbi:MAG: elongation factor P [Erysipelotrichaceae bacterium]|nr:elongation factor P [Erysipelotrichaceae bacterium]
MNVTELRPGNYFEDENTLYQVIDILLNKTAMRKMVAKVKVKNVRTGAITEIARNSGYDVQIVSITKKNMQYLYDSGTTLVFMDPKTYEQVELPKANLEHEIPFLAPNGEIIMVSYEDEILGIELPAKVALEVVETEAGVRGDTISNGGSKDAKLETGLTIRVPLFINVGEKVLVDTTTGKYDKRA